MKLKEFLKFDRNSKNALLAGMRAWEQHTSAADRNHDKIDGEERRHLLMEALRSEDVSVVRRRRQCVSSI